MTIDHRDVLILHAVRRIRILERRMTGMSAAIINATKNADRITLANSMDSVRLDLDHIYGLLENELDQRAKER